jgi:glycosyltransferase involved in cell wall biosynthesis
MNIDGLYQVYTGNYPLEIAVPGNIQLPAHYQSTLVSLCQWHPGIVGEAAQRNSYAVLPYRQGKNAKSANRVLEALWCGLPVITDPIPAVVDLGRNGIRYFEQDCENSEVMSYMMDTDFTEEMQAAQSMIQLEYSPEAIASKWAAAIRGIA